MSDTEFMLMVESRKKSGGVAALLNFFFPGGGYIYCGNWVLGIVAFFFTIIVLVATLGFGAFFVYPLLIIDGFLAAGRYNKNMVAQMIQDRAKLKRAQGAAQ